MDLVGVHENDLSARMALVSTRRSAILATMALAEDLSARGLIEHASADLRKILSGKRTIYLGVDPSADSMQAGNLVVVLLMKRLADAGHKIVLLVGGGTGMIGDPRESGERTLADAKVVARNKKAIRSQLERIIGKRITVVDNADWLLKLKLVDFLRDIGKHFTVNELVKRDIIKRRLETPDESISYTEFAYSLLQGYDFFHLFKTKGVDTQLGGSDQWTNLLSGVELIRRKLGKEAYAITCPLITDAQGKKFGKSEGNAVWLDANKTSPFAFYQFWLTLPDEGLEKYLKAYTFMPLEDVSALMEKHRVAPQDREAQETLARAVTELVHGPAITAQVAAASEVAYGKRELNALSKEDIQVLTVEVPNTLYIKDIRSTAVTGGIVSSNNEFNRLVNSHGITINNKLIQNSDEKINDSEFFHNIVILKKGKKNVWILKKNKG